MAAVPSSGEAVFLLPAGLYLPGHGHLGPLALESQLLLLAVVDQRRRDLPRAAVGEAEDARGEILHLGVLVGQIERDRLHFTGRAHHPEEQIDMVDGVVHGAAAALLGPGPAPPKIVVIAAPPPERIDLGVEGLCR